MSEKKLLVVDDEKPILEVLRDMFGYLEIEADLVDTGGEAVRRVKANPEKYNRVFLDIELEDMPGAQVFTEIHNTAPEIDVYVFSGYGDSEKSQALIGMGAVGIVQKPFSIQELQSLLKGD